MSNLSQYSPEELEELVNSGQFLSSRGNDGERSEPTSAISPSQPPSSEPPKGWVKNPAYDEVKKPYIEVPSSDPYKTINVGSPPELASRETNPQQEKLQEPTRADGFDIKDPVELLYLLDDGVNSGKIVLHSWQLQFMLDFAAGGADYEHPFHALVRAANGSGKDKYIIAACAVWLCMRYIRATCPITSSSGQQLDTQTCRHISYLCEQANRKIYDGIWKVNYRHYACLATGSLIDCFATDEPGKAEGFHPLDAGCKMALFMSEAKTVTDEINSAYDRCDGYTHRIHVSSPGPPTGHFYSDCIQSIPRDTIKRVDEIEDYSQWIHYLITAFDCNHISRVRIKKLIDKYGEKDPLVQSSIYAEFTSVGEMVVIPWHFVNNCVETKDSKWIQEPYNDGGLDLADGGDETVLITRNGNKVIHIDPFQLDNSDDTFHYLDELLRERGLNNIESHIYADCGGIGKPTLDRLGRNGWKNIKYVDNRHAAFDKLAFYKRATELWWHLRMLMQRKEIILLNDKKLKEQLAGRYYKFRDGTIRHLLSKQEQKAKGYNSPDRADGTVLAFYRYKSKPETSRHERPYKPEESKLPVKVFSQRDWSKVDGQTKEAILNPSRNKDFTILRDEIKQYNERRKLLVN